MKKKTIEKKEEENDSDGRSRNDNRAVLNGNREICNRDPGNSFCDRVELRSHGIHSSTFIQIIEGNSKIGRQDSVEI